MGSVFQTTVARFGVGVRAVGVESAAKMIGVGKTTIREAIRSGKLKSYRIGRRVLVKISDLDAFLENGGSRS